MKDIENKHREFISRVKSLAKEENVPYFYPDRLKTIGQESGYLLNENLVGVGQECVVVTDQQTPELVVAFTYKDLSPIEAKRIFYAQRIFSTLFPHNFPHFDGACSGEYARTIRQRMYRAENTPIKYPFVEVILKAVFEWGISRMIFDGASFNYVIGPDGGQYYLDSIALEKDFEHNLTTEKTRNNISYFMKEHSFSDRDIAVVESSITRLNQLV